MAAAKMRLGIIGRTGQLAQAAAVLARRRGWTTLRLGRARLGLEQAVDPPAALAAFRPTHLLVAAAYTDVDGSEREPGLALAVNALAVGRLAAWAALHGVRLVYPSTDYVFDGAKDAPYLPTDRPSPLGRYGESKALGEREALACPGALVARTAWLYGLGPGHFPAKILRAARGGRPLRVVDDQSGSPTWVFAYARTLLDLMAAGVEGVVHAACSGATSWYQFATEILASLGLPNAVEPVATADLGQLARRPQAVRLEETRWPEWGVVPPPPWKEALASFLGQPGPARRAAGQMGEEGI